MRRVAPFLLGFAASLVLLLDASAQTARPQFRPAVLGSRPDSLVNLIDTEALLKAGQKEGAVMFCALVSPAGDATKTWTTRVMPGSAALEEEVGRRLQGVKFTPAIYQYQPVGVLLYGTVNFSPETKPHLRILLSQDIEELAKQSDFVGPQPVIGADSKFDGLTPPPNPPSVPLTAFVDLKLKVDKLGNLGDLRVLAEDPPLLGFGQAAFADFREAKFIPAFRDGDPAESETTLPVCYKPAE